MPHTNTHPNNNRGVVVSKEPVVHHTHTNHHWSKRQIGYGRLLLGLMMLMAWTVFALPITPAHAAADSCPNAALRALNDSTRLPDCRAYELVTSPYKQGFGVYKQSYGDHGAVAYTSTGNFADNAYAYTVNQYVARRSETGWKTISMNPPGEPWVAWAPEGASGLSGDFRSSMWVMRPRSEGPGERWADHSDRDGLYVRRPDGMFSLLAPNPGAPTARVYMSTSDLSHVVFGGDHSVPAPTLYDVTGGDQVLHPIGVDNTGAPLSGVGELCSLGMSEDGRVIFVGKDYFSGCYGPLARVGGVRTIDMSVSQCTRGVGDPGGPCNAPALVSFVGFARDGSRAFMTTTQQLVNGDTDDTMDVYVCDIPAGTVAAEFPVNDCPNLRQITAGVPGGADVEYVVRASADGSHVYFVAHSVLAANHGANDQTAVAGAHNLYVWQTDAEHPEGHTTFVARLITPGDVGDKSTSSTQVTPDGRYLVVNTRDPLVSSGPAADADGAADVYRYDSKTGQWLRLSTDSTGSGGNAEISTLVMFYNALADDGQTIVFITSEALAPGDANSFSDVYAWHEGQVSLISPDGGGDPAISASGTDIFFRTSGQVTAADNDTSADVYTARIGGGFDLRESGSCEGEGCPGAPSVPPGLASGVGGLGGQGDVKELAPGFVLRSVSVAQRRALARSGRVTVTVTTNSPGLVLGRVTTTIGGKPSNGAVARATLEQAGSVQLTLRLSAKARARLVAKRRVSVRVVVSHSKVALPKSATLNLTLAAKTTSKKAARSGSLAGRGADVKGGRS